MKHTHPNNSTRRMLAKSWRSRAGVLLMTLIALSFMTIEPALGQTRNTGKDVPAGYDLFKTVQRGTQFQFREEFTIPAGFFDEKSRPFAGAINFKGVPIGSYRDQKTGDTDTIVERKSAAQFYGRQARATVPIEVVALSLESVRPIRVQAGGKWQSWNVKVELSPSRKSEGTMTIIRRNAKGGTFNSEFVVYALFTFTREGDGMEKRLDVGTMQLGKRSIDKITLRTTGAPWSQNCGSDFCAGVTVSGILVNVTESGRWANHQIIFDRSPAIQ